MRSVALVLLALLSPAAALAEDAVVDGIKFRIPEGTTFILPLPNVGPATGAALQAGIDRNRANPAWEGILFTTDAVPGKPFVALLKEPETRSPQEERRALARATQPFEKGVGRIDKADVPGPGRVGYVVLTALPYAPVAEVFCKPDDTGPDACMMLVTVDRTLRLNLQKFGVDQTSEFGIRESVINAISFVVPEGAEKRKVSVAPAPL